MIDRRLHCIFPTRRCRVGLGLIWDQNMSQRSSISASKTVEEGSYSDPISDRTVEPFDLRK